MSFCSAKCSKCSVINPVFRETSQFLERHRTKKSRYSQSLFHVYVQYLVLLRSQYKSFS